MGNDQDNGRMCPQRMEDASIKRISHTRIVQ